MAQRDPFQEGKDAYLKGKRRRDNPYHMAESAHESWDEGWVEAEENDGN